MRGYEQWVLHEESSLFAPPITHGEQSSIFEDDRAVGEDTQTMLREALGVHDKAMGEDTMDISRGNQPNFEFFFSLYIWNDITQKCIWVTLCN